MSLKMVLAGALGVLAIAGCSKNDNSPAGHLGNEIDKSATEAKLRAHKYASACDSTNLLWKAGGVNSTHEVFNFQNGDAGRTIEMFSDANCTQANLVAQATYSGTQTVGNAAANNQGRTIDLNYTKVVVTISNQSLVDALNSHLVPSCDINDWKVGEGRDVTSSAGGATCLAVPKPAQFFDIVDTDGNQVWFGVKDAGHNGLTDAARPVQLDKSHPYNIFNP